jgi:hypothetical protein
MATYKKVINLQPGDQIIRDPSIRFPDLRFLGTVEQVIALGDDADTFEIKLQPSGSFKRPAKHLLEVQ